MKSRFRHPALIASGITFLLSAVLYGLGILLHIPFPEFDAAPLYLIFLVAMALFCLVNRLASKAYANRRFGMPVDERQKYMDAHRAKVAADPEGTLRSMGNLALYHTLLLSLYGLLTAGMLIACVMANSPAVIVSVMISVYLLFMPIYAALCAVPPKFDKHQTVRPDCLPILHGLAQKAARTVGVKGRVDLYISSDVNCEVIRVGRGHVVYLGTRLLAVATEEEVYQLLLREFAYFACPAWERRYLLYCRLSVLGSAQIRPATWVFDLFISPADARMEWELPLYDIALSRLDALMATDCIRRHGNPRADLDIEAKQQMWDYFSFESARYPLSDYWLSPKAHADWENVICTTFRRALEERQKVWSDLLDGRLARENDTWPTFSEYRRLLGMEGMPALSRLSFPDPESPYGRECTAAICNVVAIATMSMTQEAYDGIRKERYVKPMEIIRAWESSDQNCPVSEIATVQDAYYRLGHIDELEALCDRVLAREQNPFVQANSIYMKGICRLFRYDTTGLDSLYRAMDLNKNYMKSGLEMAEEYICLCGLSDELTALRRRAAIMTEAHSYNYECANTLLPTDRLVREEALSEQLPAILAYMEKVGGGCLSRVYLVRKVISEDFFSSAFVLDFIPGSDSDETDRVYEAIFRYLDAYPVDWQFSLFIYDRLTEAAVRRVPGSLVWERKE